MILGAFLRTPVALFLEITASVVHLTLDHFDPCIVAFQTGRTRDLDYPGILSISEAPPQQDPGPGSAGITHSMSNIGFRSS